MGHTYVSSAEAQVCPYMYIYTHVCKLLHMRRRKRRAHAPIRLAYMSDTDIYAHHFPLLICSGIHTNMPLYVYKYTRMYAPTYEKKEATCI